MSLLVAARNALSLLLHGEWREFEFRLRVRLGQIDLQTAELDQLRLSGDRSYHYADSGGLHLDQLLRSLRITAEDAIIDFGCGKGGALFTFSKHPFAKVAGCEISAELAAIAENNLKAMKVDNVVIQRMDAAELKDLDRYNYFYFFNPFPCNIMMSVISNIKSSLARRQRQCTIIYCNPECHEIVVADSPFVKVREFQQHALTYYIYSNVMIAGNGGGVHAAEG